MKTIVSSNYFDDFNTVKLSALYFEQIIIPDTSSGLVEIRSEPDENGFVKDARIGIHWKTLPETIMNEYKLLFQERIAIPDEDVSDIVPQGTIYENFDDIREDIFIKRGEDTYTAKYDELNRIALGKSKCITVIQDESETYYSLMDIVGGYYSSISEGALASMIKYELPLITDSDVVSKLLAFYLSKNRLSKRYNLQKQKIAFLSQRIMQEFIPNIKDVPVEDILEIRTKFKDELLAFRSSLGKLSEDIESNPWTQDSQVEIDKLIEVNIKPAIEELKKSLEYSRLKIVSNVFDNLKNPTTYVPFLCTVFSGIEPTVSLLASLGIAGFKTLYDSYLNTKKIKNENGFVYLLKAPKVLLNK